MRLYSIGHSNLSLADFIATLERHGVTALADVRRFPGSRRWPHFSHEALTASLAERGIEAVHIPELGGRRKPLHDSQNTGWESAQFRGYADHMASAEFASGVARLLAMAKGRPTAFMCAEALWWQCHRRLLSDWLLAHGHGVLHLRFVGTAEQHALKDPARIVDGHLAYPGAPMLLLG